ncbi:MAG: response regulator [Firmicutes bacterium]|nr:response regulator [Bacillota bacterium]
MSHQILLVDDAQIIRLMLTRILAAGGYQIAGEAANGYEAIAQYKKLHPDLVTMDITMPDMSGIEAVRAIKEYDPEAKIIICSALGHKFLIQEAIEAGADNFITKPFQPEQVLAVVSAALAQK